MERIGQVAVVIPVHNEEQLLPAALAAVRAAADALQAQRPAVAVDDPGGAGQLYGRVLGSGVALGCGGPPDQPVAGHVPQRRRKPAGRHPRGTAGQRRRPGSRMLPRSSGWPIPTPIPAFRKTGCCARWSWLTAGPMQSWEPWNRTRKARTANSSGAGTLRHPLGEDHPHVHGANLGVRASAYVLAGGFPRLRSHEDRGIGGAASQARVHGVVHGHHPGPDVRPDRCPRAAGIRRLSAGTQKGTSGGFEGLRRWIADGRHGPAQRGGHARAQHVQGADDDWGDWPRSQKRPPRRRPRLTPGAPCHGKLNGLS